MGFNWKKYIPTITWKQNHDEDTMIALLVEQDATISGLNLSVGLLAQNIDNLKSEAINILSAVAMQHGGELRVKQEFFEAIKGDKDLSLKIENDNGDMILKLEIETEGNNAEEIDAEDERDEY